MKNYKVAITGGIGSGKSTVLKIIGELGFPVFSCDEIYKKLILDERVVLKISDICKTPPIKTEKGVLLAKKAVSDKVFTDKSLKKELEEYTHPLIMKELLSEAEKCDGVSFSEVPLLFEGNYQSFFDRVVIVVRDKDKRINSVCARDGLSSAEVQKRMENQINYEDFSPIGHTVLYNDGDLLSLKNKTAELIGEIQKNI